jgi:putative cardiolipin synthase
MSRYNCPSHKAFTVDNRTGFTGFFNLDPCSASLNTQMGVLFGQSDLVRAMRDLFSHAIAAQTARSIGRVRWKVDSRSLVGPC